MVDGKTVLEYWNSDVARWHSHRSPLLRKSGDGTDAHTARCLRLLFALNPEPSMVLVRSVLDHDVGERKTGDMPATLKRGAGELSDLLSDYEDHERERVSQFIGHVLSDQDVAWLHLVDKLDAYIWIALYNSTVLATPAGMKAISALHDFANVCNVSTLVSEIMSCATKAEVFYG